MELYFMPRKSHIHLNYCVSQPSIEDIIPVTTFLLNISVVVDQLF